MLTPKQLLGAIIPADRFTMINLIDAYFHVAIHPEDHGQFLRFAFKGKAYEYLVLPFGLSLALCTFTKCVEAALAPLQERGVYIQVCLGDWARLESSSEWAAAQPSQTLIHPQPTIFLPRVGNVFFLRLGTSARAQGGRISLLSHSISVVTWTMFPNDFTADRHDDVNDRSGATRAGKDVSVSSLNAISLDLRTALRPNEQSCIASSQGRCWRGYASGLPLGEFFLARWTVVKCRFHINYLELLTTFWLRNIFILGLGLGLE